jgi:hypothetical protein
MQFFKTVLFAVFCLNISPVAASSTDKSGTPFDVYPFVVPQNISVDLSNYRNQWDRLTGFEYSGLHWMQFIVVYSNTGKEVFLHNYKTYLDQFEAEEEEEDFDGSFQKYSEGAVVVKENYNSDHGRPGQATTLTIMIKHAPGYDADNGDWEYMQTDVSGNILLRGNSADVNVNKTCAECHANVAERDYVFSTFYSKVK